MPKTKPFQNLTIRAYFKHDLEKKIADYRKEGYVVVNRGYMNADGTRCWAQLRFLGKEFAQNDD